MFTAILKSLYFFLPAYLANMTPVLVKRVPFLAQPVWEKFLGPNKTWRGFLFGTLAGGLIFILQRYLYLRGVIDFALIDYAGFGWWFGFLQGFGALLGDAVKSYYKRRSKIAPGKPWLPWDQLDFVFGAIIVGGLVYFPPAYAVLSLLVFSPLLHLLTNYLGYLLRLKNTKW